jgi:hypothetical protein
MFPAPPASTTYLWQWRIQWLFTARLSISSATLNSRVMKTSRSRDSASIKALRLDTPAAFSPTLSSLTTSLALVSAPSRGLFKLWAWMSTPTMTPALSSTTRRLSAAPVPTMATAGRTGGLSSARASRAGRAGPAICTPAKTTVPATASASGRTSVNATPAGAAYIAPL